MENNKSLLGFAEINSQQFITGNKHFNQRYKRQEYFIYIKKWLKLGHI